MSASICASSSAGGPTRSALQASAPVASISAAAASIEFLNFIRESAPQRVRRRGGITYDTKHHTQRKQAARRRLPRRLLSLPDDRKTTSGDRKTTSRFLRDPSTVKRSNGGAALSLHPVCRLHGAGGMCESDPDQVPQYRKDDLHGLLDGS